MFLKKAKKQPCIRGLKEFRTTGCPREAWDKKTGTGCPAWREYYQKLPDGSKRLMAKDCIDLLSEFWLHELLKTNETVIKTTESFRDGMCEAVDDGRVVPKMDRAVLGLVSILQREKEDRELLESQKQKAITES